MAPGWGVVLVHNYSIVVVHYFFITALHDFLVASLNRIPFVWCTISLCTVLHHFLVASEKYTSIFPGSGAGYTNIDTPQIGTATHWANKRHKGVHIYNLL